MRTSTHRLPGLVLSNHQFLLPLNHERPGGEKIVVFAREVVSVEHEHMTDLPWLVFFQGGPGFCIAASGQQNRLAEAGAKRVSCAFAGPARYRALYSGDVSDSGQDRIAAKAG